MRVLTAAAIAALLMVGSAAAFAQQANQATAELRDPDGDLVGTAELTQESDGVRISVQVQLLPPGTHGIHVHAVGRCDPPDFMSAGPHFNPTNRQHGLRNPAGPHAGDLPNIDIAADGRGQLTTTNNMLTLGTGANSLFDTDGSAIVVHTDPDDEMTDPTGNSGGRIACRVVTAAPAAAPPAQPAAPAAKPAAPAAKPAAQPSPPAAQPAAQVPRALPRTGDVAGLAANAIPAGLAGMTLLRTGIALRRRR